MVFFFGTHPSFLVLCFTVLMPRALCAVLPVSAYPACGQYASRRRGLGGVPVFRDPSIVSSVVFNSLHHHTSVRKRAFWRQFSNALPTIMVKVGNQHSSLTAFHATAFQKRSVRQSWRSHKSGAVHTTAFHPAAPK